jgi:hypothetical protein
LPDSNPPRTREALTPGMGEPRSNRRGRQVIGAPAVDTTQHCDTLFITKPEG